METVHTHPNGDHKDDGTKPEQNQMFVKPENEFSEQDNSPPKQQLMAKEEYLKKISDLERTKTGSVFSVLKSERKRVLYMGLMKFFIAIHFNFCKVFKDNVVYSVLDNVNAVYWLKIFIFVASFATLCIWSKLFASKGPQKAIEIFLLFSCAVYTGMGVLVFLNDYICELGFVHELFHASKFSIRNLGILETFFSLIYNFIMVMYYIIVDLLSNMLISVAFVTYLGYRVTPNQMPRYYRIMGIFNGFSYLMCRQLVKSMVRLKDGYFSTRTVKWLYIAVYLANAVSQIFILCLKRLLDKELDKIIYEGEDTDRGCSKKKIDSNISIKQIGGMLYNSSFFRALTGFIILYNLVTVIFSLTDKFVYKAYEEYLKSHPEDNPLVGASPSASNIAMHFKSAEMIGHFYLLLILMTSPILSRAWSKFGFGLFGGLLKVTYLYTIISSTYMAIHNYPFTNFGNKTIFGIGFKNSEPNFYMEAVFIASNTFIIKATKNALFDMSFEAITSRIDPQRRLIYKNILSGIFPNVTKMFFAIFGILSSTMMGVKDNRFLLPFYAMGIILVLITCITSVILVSKKYSHAVKHDIYIKEH